MSQQRSAAVYIYRFPGTGALRSTTMHAKSETGLKISHALLWVDESAGRPSKGSVAVRKVDLITVRVSTLCDPMKAVCVK